MMTEHADEARRPPLTAEAAASPAESDQAAAGQGVTALSQGMSVDASDPQALAEALTLACDYRGDVTLTLRNGEVLEGYIFDRRRQPPSVRLLLKAPGPDGSDRRTVPDANVAQLQVTGRDTASGKSFESWVKRYVEKKLRGERADIECEPLA